MSQNDVVVKIGGSLLHDTFSYIDVAEKIVKTFIDSGYRPFIVVSAAKGITDNLIKVAKGDLKTLNNVIDKYMTIAGGFNNLKIVKRVSQELEHLKRIVLNISNIDPSLYDLVLSFGERISKILMVEALEICGVRSVELDARDIIVTNDVHGDASIDYNQTLLNLEKIYSSLRDKAVVPVIEGFIGATEDGMVTTLGRGGSDYTATTIASLLGFDRVYLVTDVDGIMTTDPDIIPTARIVKMLSYREAMEASIHGAKRINPKAFEPLEKFYSSRVFIGSFRLFGTEIRKELPVEDQGPKIVMDRKGSDYGSIAIIGEGVSRSKYIKMVLNVLESVGIDILGIQGYVHRPSLIIYVDNSTVNKALRIIHREFFEGE